MNEVKKQIERPELFNAIQDSIKDARSAAKRLAEAFTDNVQSLRIEESERVFIDLIQNIQDLECFIDFIRELKEGLVYFDGFGLPSDPILSQNSGLNLFQEMYSALESRDWIMLSDLVEYELSPLLVKEGEWLGALDDKILEYGG